MFVSEEDISARPLPGLRGFFVIGGRRREPNRYKPRSISLVSSVVEDMVRIGRNDGDDTYRILVRIHRRGTYVMLKEIKRRIQCAIKQRQSSPHVQRAWERMS